MINARFFTFPKKAVIYVLANRLLVFINWLKLKLKLKLLKQRNDKKNNIIKISFVEHEANDRTFSKEKKTFLIYIMTKMPNKKQM